MVVALAAYPAASLVAFRVASLAALALVAVPSSLAVVHKSAVFHLLASSLPRSDSSRHLSLVPEQLNFLKPTLLLHLLFYIPSCKCSR